MILLLSNYLNSLSQNNEDLTSLRGSECKSDTAILVSLDYIRKANGKLIERKYLIEINNQKDSIINLKDEYIIEQKLIIDTLQTNITKQKILIDNVNKDLNKQKKNIIYYSIGCTVLGFIIGLIIK